MGRKLGDRERAEAVARQRAGLARPLLRDPVPDLRGGFGMAAEGDLIGGAGLGQGGGMGQFRRNHAPATRQIGARHFRDLGLLGRAVAAVDQ
ncbi:hypothetical protein QWZ10_23215 [Paracoccus cavernae]|uniref:Uncharacterized protein n=1 Tax=Paracoccus cavernae TaxID=1571207 RepID=A0ABT8DBZ6_9RHOB|nr:hypothetical protein [Paracoccus cavernae]